MKGEELRLCVYVYICVYMCIRVSVVHANTQSCMLRYRCNNVCFEHNYNYRYNTIYKDDEILFDK